jgi:HSP20 family protein
MLSVKLNRKPADRSFDNFVDSFITELPSLFKHDFNGYEANGWVPVNVKETAKAYELEVVAPGFEKSDFKVNLDKDLLTISAEKKSEVKEENGQNDQKHIRREYSYRSFKRTFTIDDKINATEIVANYINGILTLNLPKKEEVKAAATSIEVK